MSTETPNKISRRDLKTRKRNPDKLAKLLLRTRTREDLKAQWGICKGNNLDAAKRARRKILNDENSVEHDIRDMLANLRHLCDAVGLDFAEVDRLAYRTYREEVGDPGEIEARPPGVPNGRGGCYHG